MRKNAKQHFHVAKNAQALAINVSKVHYIIHVKKNVKEHMSVGIHARRNAMSNVEFARKSVNINVVRRNVTENVVILVMNARTNANWGVNIPNVKVFAQKFVTEALVTIHVIKN